MWCPEPTCLKPCQGHFDDEMLSLAEGSPPRGQGCVQKHFACVLSRFVSVETPGSRLCLFLFYKGESWSLEKFQNLPG